MSAKTFASSGFELSMVKKERPGILKKTAVHENFASILPNSLTTATDSGSIHRSFPVARFD
jgi:hypothetical protein